MGQKIPGTCGLLQSDFLGKEAPSPALYANAEVCVLVHLKVRFPCTLSN